MSKERAKKIRTLLRDVLERQASGDPTGVALRELMPIDFGRFLDHAAGNAAMVIDQAIEEGEL